MTQQMSLFPAQEPPDEKQYPGDGERGALDEMFAVSPTLRDPQRYRELLQFIARFPQYSPFNALLLYLQNPRLSHVATAGSWYKRHGRRLKKSARPLIILAPMSPVRFVYDIDDTDGGPVPAAALKTPASSDAETVELLEKTVHNCAVHGIAVRELAVDRRQPQGAIQLAEDNRLYGQSPDSDAAMRYLVLLDREHAPQDRYAALVHESGRILCGHRGCDQNAWWQDRQQAPAQVKTIEADSVAYLVCQRKRFVHSAETFLGGMVSSGPPLPAIGLSAVLQAVHYIEKMGRSRWKTPRKAP